MAVWLGFLLAPSLRWCLMKPKRAHETESPPVRKIRRRMEVEAESSPEEGAPSNSTSPGEKCSCDNYESRGNGGRGGGESRRRGRKGDSLRPRDRGRSGARASHGLGKDDSAASRDKGGRD